MLHWNYADVVTSADTGAAISTRGMQALQPPHMQQLCRARDTLQAFCRRPQPIKLQQNTCNQQGRKFLK